MGKKRKSSSRSIGQKSAVKNSEEDSKRRINNYEDVADSEDEFLINRDKVLLDEGPAQKRQRLIQEEEALLEPSDEEVLGLPSGESDQDEDGISEDETDSEDNGNRETLEQRRPDDFSESEASNRAKEEDEDGQGWGASRQDYYNADPITTEADALEEEAEAKRLQKKQLQTMTDADFGLDEIDWVQAGKDSNKLTSANGNVVTQTLPKLEITDSMSPEEKLKILKIRYPEFEPLAKEYLGLQTEFEDLQLASKAATAVAYHNTTSNDKALPISSIKLSTLSGYLATLSMYFALFTSTDTNPDEDVLMSPEDLHEHSIMTALVQYRQLWERVKTIKIPSLTPLEIDLQTEQPDLPNGHSKFIPNRADIPPTTEIPTSKLRRTHAQRRAARVHRQAEEQASALRAARLEKMNRSLASLSSLTALPFNPSNDQNSAPAVEEIDSDIGDPLPLTAAEAAQKAARKKSLRFYTSQIAQRSNRRSAAGKDAGGDMDVPYKERLKDRTERINAEAEARGKKAGKKTEELDGNLNDSGPENENEQQNLARSLRTNEDEDYYDLVASHAAKKKAHKSSLAATTNAQSQRPRITDAEDIGPDGKRAISYAIAKNKGLAPHRKKDVRNPRVKKRKKFEDKKKKLGSVRQVCRGGEGRGGYGGELTGIKSGLVRSVKL